MPVPLERQSPLYQSSSGGVPVYRSVDQQTGAKAARPGKAAQRSGVCVCVWGGGVQAQVRKGRRFFYY